MIVSNITLYAQWELRTYIVQFNANGGIDVSESITRDIGQAFNIPAKIPVLEGYKFYGWRADISINETKDYQPGEVYEFGGTRSMWSIWGNEVIYDPN